MKWKGDDGCEERKIKQKIRKMCHSSNSNASGTAFLPMIKLYFTPTNQKQEGEQRWSFSSWRQEGYGCLQVRRKITAFSS